MGNGTAGLELNAKVRIQAQESGEAWIGEFAEGLGVEFVFIL